MKLKNEFGAKDSIHKFDELLDAVTDVYVSFKYGRPEVDAKLPDSLQHLLIWLKNCRTPIPEDIQEKLVDLYQKYSEFLERDRRRFAGAFDKAHEFIKEFSQTMDDPRIRAMISAEEVRVQTFDKSRHVDFEEFHKLIMAQESRILET